MPIVIDTSKLLQNTIVPLWLGAGKAAGNTTLGGLGAILKGLGGMFEPTDEQLRQQRELYRKSGEFVGLPEELAALDYTDYQPNLATKAGNFLLNTNAKLQNGVNNARQDILGSNQNAYTRATEGIGAMLIPFLFASPLGGNAAKAVKAFSEAAAETGYFVTDMHSQGKYKDGTGKIALKNFLANLALNAGLEATPDGSDLLKFYDSTKDWTSLQQIIANIGKELFDEAVVQEPLQRSIYDVSVNNKKGYLEGLRDYPNKLFEVMTGR